MAGDLDALSASALLGETQLGRNQWPVQLATTTLNTMAQAVAPPTWQPGPIDLTLPLGDLFIRWRGRIAVTAANYTAVSPEAVFNLLQNVTLQGNHQIYGGITPINMSGAAVMHWGRISQQISSSMIVNATRVADPGQPQAAGAALTTAGSPYDCDLVWWVPLYPVMGVGRTVKRVQQQFYYLSSDWNNSLQPLIKFGDASALGDPTGATVTFTAFNSGAGNPTAELYGNYAIQGDFAGKLPSGICVRNEQPIVNMTAAVANAQLFQLGKYATTAIMVRSGLVQTAGVTSGTFAYRSVSDVMLDKTSIYVGAKPVRNNLSNIVAKAFYQAKMNTVVPQGVFVQSFMDSQAPTLAYRGDTLPGGTSYTLNSDVLTASADNRIFVTQEYILGGPFATPTGR